MIDQECIDELADEIGVKDHVAAITARSMNGEIAFEPALRERVALLKGLDAAVVDRIIANRLTLASGGRALVADHARQRRLDGAGLRRLRRLHQRASRPCSASRKTAPTA